MLAYVKRKKPPPKYTSVIELWGTLLEDGGDQGHGELHCDKCDLLSEWQRASGALFKVAISSTLKQGLKCLWGGCVTRTRTDLWAFLDSTTGKKT